MTRLIGILILALALFSCGDEAHFQQVKDISPKGWKISDTARFSFEIKNPGKYEPVITLRTTVNYPYSNIYLFVDMLTPQGMHMLDTIEYKLAQKNGAWIGKETGSYVENNLGFPIEITKKGKYSIAIVHGMYDEPLEEVSAIGFELR